MLLGFSVRAAQEEQFDSGDWRVSLMSGRYPGQGEPSGRGGEKSDGKSRIDAFLEWISKTSPLANIILAIAALVVGGSVVAVTVKIVVSSPAPNSTVTTVNPSGSSSAEGPDGEIDSESGTFKVADSKALSYPNGVESEVIFYYVHGNPSYLNAGPSVYLAILRAPTPAPIAAYRACEKLDNQNQQVNENNSISAAAFARGDSLCAFTPNNQVSWIQFHGTTTGQGGADPTLNVEMITWKATGS